MSDVIVGWQAGPTERGTLMLIWGCLAIIFASTWTVLHLNIPALDDKPLDIALRKAKWMAITIVFPEIAFAKAISDLMLALQDLQELDTKLQEQFDGKIEWTTERKFDGKDIKCTWSWQVDYGTKARFLYWFFRIPAPNLNKRRHEDLIENKVKDENGSNQYDSPEKNPIRIVQKWTITHAYFANMGGLVYSKDKESEFYSMPGFQLGERADWKKDSIGHPLEGLILTTEDINDKSKADWLLKGIIVLQITYLVLTIIVRWIHGLPVTQLEIATLAFSISAIATYIASWWKPKDVLRPIRIQARKSAMSEPQEGYRTVNPSRRLVTSSITPSEAVSSIKIYKDKARVKNDYFFVDGEIPTMSILTEVSALVFGGLHCIAWNFEFPSHLELILWKVSVIAAVIIPIITFTLICLSFYLIGKRGGDYEKTHDRIAACIAIITGILYTAARLITIALSFTSLRAAPRGVYEVTPWTRYLPSIT